MVRTVITKEIVNKMVSLYNQGMPIVNIADKLRVDKTTVHKYLNKVGAKTVAKEVSEQAASRLTDAQRDKLIKLYKQGMPINEMVETLGISGDAIYRQVRKEGLNRGVPKEAVDEALNLYVKQKLDVAEVLERTGLSRATFFRRLKKYREERGL